MLSHKPKRRRKRNTKESLQHPKHDAIMNEWLVSVFLLLLDQDKDKIFLGTDSGNGGGPIVRIDSAPFSKLLHITHFIPLEENYILPCMAGNGKAAPLSKYFSKVTFYRAPSEA